MYNITIKFRDNRNPAIMITNDDAEFAELIRVITICGFHFKLNEIKSISIEILN